MVRVNTKLKLFKQERGIWIWAIWNLIRCVVTLHNSTMTPSNGNTFRVTSPLCGEFTGHRWVPFTKPVMRASFFSLACAWSNGWVKNADAGDSRRHRAHHDVTVMLSFPAHCQLMCVKLILHMPGISSGFVTHTCFIMGFSQSATPRTCLFVINIFLFMWLYYTHFHVSGLVATVYRPHKTDRFWS